MSVNNSPCPLRTIRGDRAAVGDGLSGFRHMKVVEAAGDSVLRLCERPTLVARLPFFAMAQGSAEMDLADSTRHSGFAGWLLGKALSGPASSLVSALLVDGRRQRRNESC